MNRSILRSIRHHLPSDQAPQPTRFHKNRIFRAVAVKLATYAKGYPHAL